jgi:RNA:NAD 2'-phosphotransferase (TPT1/KptA family)
MAKRWRGVTLRAVVDTVEPDKQRFSIVDDEIRANYGHSIAAGFRMLRPCRPRCCFTVRTRRPST